MASDNASAAMFDLSKQLIFKDMSDAEKSKSADDWRSQVPTLQLVWVYVPIISKFGFWGVWEESGFDYHTLKQIRSCGESIF